jgi:riboflavin kinase / FMN adenylyltransferase
LQIFNSYADLASWGEKPVYLTVGFFDGVHLGHQKLIADLGIAAAGIGAESLVLTFSNSPRRFHQPTLPAVEWHYLTTAEEKLELIAAENPAATLILRYDESIAEQSAGQFLRGLMERVPLAGLCVGYDTSIGHDMVSGHEQFAALSAQLGLDFTWVEPHEVAGAPVKSSLIRALVQAGELQAVARRLGRRYELAGEVVHGKGKGRELLGIPTANLKLPDEKLLPMLGVYAGIGWVGSQHYAAAICLSSQEQHEHTILENDGVAQSTGDATLSVVTEAHLIGYDGDLYGVRLELELTEFLRGWTDFESVDDLRAQMQTDIREAARVSSGGR